MTQRDDSEITVEPEGDSMLVTIWGFIANRIEVVDFEQWAYQEPHLEQCLGEELHFDVISTDFRSKEEVFQVRSVLEKYMRSLPTHGCECIALGDLEDVAWGSESSNRVFSTLEQVKRRGDPRWWLSIYRCSQCCASWLVASEERHNDVYLLSVLNAEQVVDIESNDCWPNIFDRYEDVIRIGSERGHRVRFADPLQSSIWYTMAMVARERAGVTVAELAELLDLDYVLAKAIAEQAILKEGVQIDGVH